MSNSLKITSIIIVLVAIGAGGWFLVTKQSQKKMEVKNENQREEKQVVGEDNQKQGEEKVEELPAQGWSAQGEKTEDIDTSNWKEYCNEGYGFCLNYPRDWKVKQMKFATIWPAPVPIDCDKTPEKCKYVGVNIRSKNDVQNDIINYLNIEVVTNNEIKRKDGLYVDIIKGSEFTPGDMCLLSYIKTMNNKEKILVTTFQNKIKCDKNKHSKLFDRIINSLKVFR